MSIEFGGRPAVGSCSRNGLVVCCVACTFIDNILVRIHLIIVMIEWTGLAPWEFEVPFPSSLTLFTEWLGSLLCGLCLRVRIEWCGRCQRRCSRTYLSHAPRERARALYRALSLSRSRSRFRSRTLSLSLSIALSLSLPPSLLLTHTLPFSLAADARGDV